ncbi:MAG TPA: hypothetical protein VII35_16155, partial [Steroidobacteraceae bacterium]
IGDEVIVTWRLGPGRDETACVRACFAALNRLGDQLPAYERLEKQAAIRGCEHCTSEMLAHQHRKMAEPGTAKS